MKGSGPLLGPRPIALLAYDYPFGQWSIACELADPLAPVELPGLFAEKGGFAPCGLSAWLAKAGCPTACVLAEHSSPGTSGSLTARAAEAIVPSSNAEVRAAASTLFVVFIPRPPFAPIFPYVQKSVYASWRRADCSPMQKRRDPVGTRPLLLPLPVDSEQDFGHDAVCLSYE
jgi:hypothetical protein